MASSTSRLLAACARKARVGIGISSFVVRDARPLLPGLPIVRVENAIDLERFQPEGQAARLDRLAGAPPLDPSALLERSEARLRAAPDDPDALLRLATLRRALLGVDATLAEAAARASVRPWARRSSLALLLGAPL